MNLLRKPMKKRRMQAPKTEAGENGTKGEIHRVSPPEAWNCCIFIIIDMRSGEVVVVVEPMSLICMSIISMIEKETAQRQERCCLLVLLSL
jgi:hypothetical protein